MVLQSEGRRPSAPDIKVLGRGRNNAIDAFRSFVLSKLVTDLSEKETALICQ